jgi:SAM-dependent methyltransferase
MNAKNQNDKSSCKATPENEDFRAKYEGGKVGNRLIDNYFEAVRELTELAGITNKGAKAIEIGCGEGFSTKRINSFIPKNIKLEASEYVERQIPFAKENNPGIKVIQESVYDLSHKDESFDLIYLLEVLEHLDFPEKGLVEARRVIKNDGYLMIGVPREPIWSVLNVSRGKYWKSLGNTPGHLNRWSTSGLVKLVEKNFGPVIAIRNPLPWTLILVRKNEKK